MYKAILQYHLETTEYRISNETQAVVPYKHICLLSYTVHSVVLTNCSDLSRFYRFKEALYSTIANTFSRGKRL